MPSQGYTSAAKQFPLGYFKVPECGGVMDPPGRIRVEVSATEDGAALVIEDTAPGVPDSSLPRLFDRLYRVANDRSKNTGGAGLGLAIVKSIAASHGGSVNIDSHEGGGTRVTIALPSEEPPKIAHA